MGQRGTVVICHEKDPSRPRVIRAENFDPAKHQLWQEPPSPPLPDPQPVPAVPERWWETE